VSSGELTKRDTPGSATTQLPVRQGPVVDEMAVLRALKLDPRIPEVQALIVVAQRYDLDLVLGHLCLVNGTVMIRKNGLLHIAHRSGDYDGHKIEMEEHEDRFVATATVYRKSYAHPFSFTDECMKTERVQSPRKRARTRALRNALAEAYDVAIPVAEEEDRPLPRLPVRNSELPVADWEPTIEGRPVETVPTGPGEGVGVAPADNAPGADSPSPGLPPKAKALMARFTRLATPEDRRHEMILWATGGRSQSVKDISDDEASQLHEALHMMTRGTLPEGLPSSVVEWFETRPM